MKEIRKSKEDKDNLAKLLCETIEVNLPFFEERNKRFQKYHGIFRFELPPKKSGQKANVCVPEVYRSVLAMVANLVLPYFKEDKWVKADAHNNPQYGKDVEELIERGLDQQLQEDLNGAILQYNAYMQAAVCDDVMGKVYWDIGGIPFANDVPKQSPMKGEDGKPIIDDMGNPVMAPPVWEKKVEFQEYSKPAADIIPSEDCIWDTNAALIDDMQFIAHRTWKTRAELELLQEMKFYEGIDDIPLTPSYKYDPSKSVTASNLPEEKPLKQGTLFNDRYEVWEIWFKDPEVKYPVIFVATLVDRKYLVRYTYNPFKHGKYPFFLMSYTPTPNEKTGIGLVEPIEGLQNEINTKRNQMLDRATIENTLLCVIDKAKLKNPNSLDTWKSLGYLELQPGANPQEAVSWVQMPSSAFPVNMQDVQSLMGEIERVSGINEYTAGTSGAGRQTTVEIRQKSGKAGGILELHDYLMRMNGIHRLIELLFSMDLQILSTQGGFITGMAPDVLQAFQKIAQDPEAQFVFSLAFDPEHEDDSITNQLIIQYLPQMLANPHLNPVEVTKRFIKAIGGDVNTMLNNPFPAIAQYIFQAGMASGIPMPPEVQKVIMPYITPEMQQQSQGGGQPSPGNPPPGPQPQNNSANPAQMSRAGAGTPGNARAAAGRRRNAKTSP